MSEHKDCGKVGKEKFAPGKDGALEEKATAKDKRCGNTTRVTELDWDEVDASKSPK